jgi:hypothetical protein
MSTRPDPLADRDLRPDRLHFATGALLDREDFLAEQLYHRGRLARALLALHGTGTVAGLRVCVKDAGGDEMVEVNEGVAIDRLGRLVEVPRTACVRLGRWMQHVAGTDLSALRRARVLPGADVNPVTTQAPGPDDPQMDPPASASDEPADAVAEGEEPRKRKKRGAAAEGAEAEPEWKAWGQGYVVADVYLAFAACERGKTPAFATGPFDALDAVAPSRVRDGYELSLVPVAQTALPPDPWKDLSAAGVEARARLAQKTLLDTHPLPDWKERDRVRRPDLYPPEVDPSAVLLARLFIPVMSVGLDESPAGFARDRALRPLVNNHLRPFAYPGPALAWLAGA